MSPQDSNDRQREVARLYAAFLERVERGDELGFEEWSAQHPQFAAELRQLDAEWERWKTVLDLLASSRNAPPSKRLAEELRERFGEDVDPGVSLGGEPRPEDSGPSSDLLRRLRAHAPKGSRYRMLGEVGRGGMGAVVRVWDEDLRRTLAMKVVLGREDAAGKGPTPPVDSRTLGRFLEEAQVTGQLDHPGIVPVHELGLGTDGQVYFTMRLVRGEDLKQVFAHVVSDHDGWNTTRALSVMLKVCEAMAYAHSKGVIHRDLKPANIMVGRYGEVYVMDWGLARVVGRKDLHDVRLKDAPATSQSIRTDRREERDDTPDSPLVTMDGDVVGTPAYMSPEQAMGKVTTLGPQSDVYAVGAMLYHLLAVTELEMPYVPKGARVSARSVHMAVVQGPPKPLVELAPKAAPELIAIVEKAMSRETPTRYLDMDALATDLRAFLEGRVVSAYESGSWAEARKWVQRNKPLTAAAAAAVLALLGGIAFSWNFALDAESERVRADAERVKAEDAARFAEDERAKTAAANTELRRQAREQKLRGLIQEVARFRAQCRTTDGLDRLGKPAYQWWLDEADRLLNGVAEDREKGIEWQPGLADVQAKLAELRASPAVLPYTDEDRQRDFETHPDRERLREIEALVAMAEMSIREPLTQLERKVEFVGHLLRPTRFPPDSYVATKFATELASSDALSLNQLAWPLVDPVESRPEPEQLVRAMLLARRGVDISSDTTIRAMARDTYAWSLLWLGRFEEALKQSRLAFEESGGSEEFASKLARLQEELARWSDINRAQRDAELAKWEADLVPLRERVNAAIAATKEKFESSLVSLRESCHGRRTWRFEEPQMEWWHEQLTHLARELIWLSKMNASAVAAHLTDRAKASWAEAIEGIARSPKYAGEKWPSGDRLTPQVGLLPLGENPVTGLWEFVHLQTGTEPQRGADGRVLRDTEGCLSLTPETGMVLVLLPGGRVPKADSLIQAQEGWIPEVDLSPFLLSKYELTAGQWDRLSPAREARFAGTPELRSASRISWDDIAAMWTRELGWCDFPSESQWEYGCRAGTSTTWWTGNYDDSTEFQRRRTLANGFGLHAMHGDLWEWCGDTYNSKALPRDGDGLHDDGVDSSYYRIRRGRSMFDFRGQYGSAYRSKEPPSTRAFNGGVRPLRRITP